MSNRSKGQAAEREYQKILESQGYLVERVKGSSKWNKQVDIFGVFDLVGMNHKCLIGVQVKCNRTGGAIKKLKEFKFHPINFYIH